MQLYEPNAPTARFSQWAVQEGGIYRPCGKTIPQLPPGAYTCVLDPYGNTALQVKTLYVDDLIDVPDSLSSRVLREIEQFWTQGERFRRYGFLHRRGYLFHGKQGCGKSSLIHQVIAQIVAAGHVAFFCEDPGAFIRCAEEFRSTEPQRPLVCIFEDIDALIATYGDAALLQWLDGNLQVDRAVNIASTNYPERLDRRIIARPRRFDRVWRIESPDAHARAAYFARKMPEQSAAERRRWVKVTEGLPFAALAELVISVACLGNGLEETVTLLKELDGEVPSGGDFLSAGSPEEAPAANGAPCPQP
jgi:AAA+ superfamily predicted ATPase